MAIPPLYYACRNGHTEIVKLLLKKGAHVNTQNVSLFTPLHWAAANGHTEIVELLLKKGAHVNPIDENGSTPLHWAVANGYTEIVALLLDNKADLNIQNVFLSTPLYWAAENGHIEIVKLLLKKGAHVNPINQHSYTPLHAAAENGHKKIAKLLLKKGAYVNAIDENGFTPLYYAAANKTTEVVQLMIKIMILTKMPKPSDLDPNYSQYWGETEFLNNENIGKINGEDISLLYAVSLEHSALALARDPEIREKMSANAQRYKRECPERFPEIQKSFRKAYNQLNAIDALYRSAYTKTQESKDPGRDISNMELKLKNYDVAELIVEQMGPEEKEACAKAYLLSSTMIQAESSASAAQNQTGTYFQEVPNVIEFIQKGDKKNRKFRKRCSII